MRTLSFLIERPLGLPRLARHPLPMESLVNVERGKDVDELDDVELVVELDEDEDEKPKEDIRLNREQTLQDLRELQELTIDRASGRTSDPDG